MMYPAIMMVMGGVIMLVMFVAFPNHKNFHAGERGATSANYSSDFHGRYRQKLLVPALYPGCFDGLGIPKMEKLQDWSADLGPIHLSSTDIRNSRPHCRHLSLFKNASNSLALRRTCLTAFDITKEVEQHPTCRCCSPRDATVVKVTSRRATQEVEFHRSLCLQIATVEKSGQSRKCRECRRELRLPGDRVEFHCSHRTYNDRRSWRRRSHVVQCAAGLQLC